MSGALVDLGIELFQRCGQLRRKSILKVDLEGILSEENLSRSRADDLGSHGPKPFGRPIRIEPKCPQFPVQKLVEVFAHRHQKEMNIHVMRSGTGTLIKSIALY